MRLLRDLRRRTLSTHPVAWADAGPLYTEHMLFSGSGLDDSVGGPKLAIILHGLLGAGRNLRGFTNELFKRSDATWTAVFVDLRNHGKSSQRPGLDPPHTLEAAAKDVIATVQESWPSGQIDAIIGHSLGGKVALEVTKQLGNNSHSDRPVPPPPRQVWCLDSIPGKVPDGVSDDVSNVIHTINEIPLPIPSRDWLFKELDRRGHSNKGFQQWLASNLVLKAKNEYEWTFNVAGATEMFESYKKTEYWDLLRSPPGSNTEIHLVKAMKGGRWNKGGDSNGMADKLYEIEEEMKKSDAKRRFFVHEMPAVGHWLHAEDPKGVADLLAPRILKL